MLAHGLPVVEVDTDTVSRGSRGAQGVVIQVVVVNNSSFILGEAFRPECFLFVLYLCVFVNQVRK